MKKFLLVTGVALFNFLHVTAQKADKAYTERAGDIQKEMWDAPAQPFTVKEVAAAMNNESAVIIAKSFDIVNTARMKFKWGAMNSVQRLYYQTIYHERIKINDKASLEDYSSLEYQKKLDKSLSGNFIKMYNKTETFVGAKIIKPDGKEIIVNTSEEVITNNSKKNKESKLAISNLQVGDILDYYLRSETIQELSAEVQGPYTLFLGGDYPILYQSIRLQLDEKSGVEYVAANGAPALKESRDEDDNIILSLEKKDLPKIQSNIWTSPFRQYPYISVQYLFTTKAMDKVSHFNQGEVRHGSLSDDLLKQYKKLLETAELPFDRTAYEQTVSYFGGAKCLKEINNDSIAKVLYEAWKHNVFCSFATDAIQVDNNMNYQTANSLVGALTISRLLRYMKIDHEIILLCPRTANKLKDVMNLADFEAMIHLTTGKKYWMAFNDIVTQFNEIPAKYQGEEGLVFRPNIESYRISYDDGGRVKVPVVNADKNVETENIHVAFDPSNMQQLKFNRTAQLSGAMRHYAQKELLLIEDMEADMAVAINQKKFTERLADERKQKKMVDEFTAAFAKEKTNLKSYFENEIQEQYDQKAKELTSYAINNKGLFNSDFEFTTDFTMDNYVKKAGNNYIVEAGKLIGSVTRLNETDRERAVDIYMPFARTFIYNITVDIPKGYKVKGLENFNKEVTNETGSITATAAANGDAISIKIKQVYNNNYEPLSNWQKLLQLVDAMYNVSTQKLLLEKSN